MKDYRIRETMKGTLKDNRIEKAFIIEKWYTGCDSDINVYTKINTWVRMEWEFKTLKKAENWIRMKQKKDIIH